jgi:hypothetical protein
MGRLRVAADPGVVGLGELVVARLMASSRGTGSGFACAPRSQWAMTVRVFCGARACSTCATTHTTCALSQLVTNCSKDGAPQDFATLTHLHMAWALSFLPGGELNCTGLPDGLADVQAPGSSQTWTGDPWRLRTGVRVPAEGPPSSCVA